MESLWKNSYRSSYWSQKQNVFDDVFNSIPGIIWEKWMYFWQGVIRKKIYFFLNWDTEMSWNWEPMNLDTNKRRKGMSKILFIFQKMLIDSNMRYLAFTRIYFLLKCTILVLFFTCICANFYGVYFYGNFSQFFFICLFTLSVALNQKLIIRHLSLFIQLSNLISI